MARRRQWRGRRSRLERRPWGRPRNAALLQRKAACRAEGPLRAAADEQRVAVDWSEAAWTWRYERPCLRTVDQSRPAGNAATEAGLVQTYLTLLLLQLQKKRMKESEITEDKSCTGFQLRWAMDIPREVK